MKLFLNLQLKSFFITENLIETTNYIHLNGVKMLHLEEKIIGQKKPNLIYVEYF